MSAQRLRALGAVLTPREAALLAFFLAEAEKPRPASQQTWTRAGWLAGEDYRRYCRHEAGRLIEQARERAAEGSA